MQLTAEFTDVVRWPNINVLLNNSFSELELYKVNYYNPAEGSISRKQVRTE